jgi:hypothetical protein
MGSLTFALIFCFDACNFLVILKSLSPQGNRVSYKTALEYQSHPTYRETGGWRPVSL